MELQEEEIIPEEVKQSVEDIFKHTCQENKNALHVALDDNLPGKLIRDSTYTSWHPSVPLRVRHGAFEK